jgi:hypothetical protein
MNKEEFLKQMHEALRGLPASEIEEILADYRAHFDESAANGRDEEATAAALGDPSWLAREHVADRGEEEGGLRSFAKRLWAATAGQRSRDDDEVIERALRWVPGRRMAINVPADVSWRPAETPRAILRGPAWLLEHVHLDSEQLRGRFKWRLFHDNRIQVELEGPSIETWLMRGSGDLHLHHLSQEKLRLELEGSGEIDADGRVVELEVTLSGSGDIELGKLESERARASIKGSGDITLAPRIAAELSILGSGDITLLSHPEIKSHIAGSGDIRIRN